MCVRKKERKPRRKKGKEERRHHNNQRKNSREADVLSPEILLLSPSFLLPFSPSRPSSCREKVRTLNKRDSGPDRPCLSLLLPFPPSFPSSCSLKLLLASSSISSFFGKEKTSQTRPERNPGLLRSMEWIVRKKRLTMRERKKLEGWEREKDLEEQK